jgi:hypothetical protein
MKLSDHPRQFGCREPLVFREEISQRSLNRAPFADASLDYAVHPYQCSAGQPVLSPAAVTEWLTGPGRAPLFRAAPADGEEAEAVGSSQKETPAPSRI